MIKTTSRDAQLVLDKLASYSVEGNGVLAECPVHPDSHASLKIDIQEEGRMLLFCRAGCKFVEIAQFLDVNKGDVWEWPETVIGVSHTTANPAGTPFTRFLEKRADGVGYAKAASFLMHTPDFSNIRNFLVGNCQYFLQDASGIRADFLAQYFNVSYYGNYAGPIDMFSEYDQPDLRAIYQTGVAKPLPFGTGYRYLDKDSVQMFGVRK